MKRPSNDSLGVWGERRGQSPHRRVRHHASVLPIHGVSRVLSQSLWLALVVAASSGIGWGQEHERRIALLVGCTHYDNLGESFQLLGPGNDVLLMRKLLVERFGFPHDAITILSEASGQEYRPTRANIEREFRRLARVARSGDQILVLLAGHGSQAPARSAPQDSPAVRMHKVFLPADVGQWDGGKGIVVNSILDDEFHDWVQDIRKSGAYLWVVVDACHSGGMIRGAGEEVVRQVPPSLLVPAEVMREVSPPIPTRGEQTRGNAEEDAGLRLADDEKGLVALFAAQASEVTVEKTLPTDSRDGQRYGLFSYAICQTLAQASAPLTYAELIQRVQAQYIRWGRTFPTPLVQGSHRDREVLGTRDWPGRSGILLASDDDGLKINAGALQGLSKNTILAVWPPAGQARGEQPLGYVKIVERATLESRVEPCDHERLRTDRRLLPMGGVCEPAVIDYGDLRLRAAADPQDNHGQEVPAAEFRQLQDLLRAMGAGPNSLVEAVDEARQADWLARWDRGQVYLVPAAGVAEADHGELPRLYGPAPADASRQEGLRQRLEQIARVRNLQQLAGSFEEGMRGDVGVRVAVEPRLLASKADRQGQALPKTAPLTLHDGDRVMLQLSNPNRFPLDVTLLYINGGWGIDCLFPAAGELNRLDPGEMHPIFIRVTAKTTGLEHLVVVAVKGTAGQPVNFSALAQPTLEEAQAAERTRGGPSATDSPLGRLLNQAMFATGGTRSVDCESLDQYRLDILSWKVVPGKREP